MNIDDLQGINFLGPLAKFFLLLRKTKKLLKNM